MCVYIFVVSMNFHKMFITTTISNEKKVLKCWLIQQHDDADNITNNDQFGDKLDISQWNYNSVCCIVTSTYRNRCVTSMTCSKMYGECQTAPIIAFTVVGRSFDRLSSFEWKFIILRWIEQISLAYDVFLWTCTKIPSTTTVLSTITYTVAYMVRLSIIKRKNKTFFFSCKWVWLN